MLWRNDAQAPLPCAVRHVSKPTHSITHTCARTAPHSHAHAPRCACHHTCARPPLPAEHKLLVKLAEQVAKTPLRLKNGPKPMSALTMPPSKPGDNRLDSEAGGGCGGWRWGGGSRRVPPACRSASSSATHHCSLFFPLPDPWWSRQLPALGHCLAPCLGTWHAARCCADAPASASEAGFICTARVR